MSKNAIKKLETMIVSGLDHVQKVIEYSTQGRIQWKADQLPASSDKEKTDKVRASSRPFIGTGEGYTILVLQANVTTTDDPAEKPRIIHEGVVIAPVAPHTVRLAPESASLLWHQAAAKQN